MSGCPRAKLAEAQAEVVAVAVARVRRGRETMIQDPVWIYRECQKTYMHLKKGKNY